MCIRDSLSMLREETLVDAAMVAFEGEPELQLTMVDLLVDAIGGVGLPTIAIAIAAEKEHMAVFIGNQHDENWSWRKDKLAQLSEAKLQALYYNLKVAQHGR